MSRFGAAQVGCAVTGGAGGNHVGEGRLEDMIWFPKRHTSVTDLLAALLQPGCARLLPSL